MTALDFIAVLRSWTSYQEKKSLGTDAQMKVKDWNPGYNNYTWFWIAFNNFAGWTCQGQAWCFGFIVSCMLEAVGLTETCRLLGVSGASALPVNCASFCSSHSVSTTPKVGALVFFHNGTKYYHVGVVTGVYDSYITSIEGNTSGGSGVDPDGGAVVEKSHTYGSVTMRYYMPDYDTETESVTVSDEYIIMTGEKGLRVTQDLNFRDAPKTGEILGTFEGGTFVYPIKKVFVYDTSGSAPWYYDPNYGWFSAKYATGWVYEESALRWWWLMKGYGCDYNKVFWIDSKLYYADNTGYIATSQWVDIDGEYSYFDADGYMVFDRIIDDEYIGSDGVMV